MKLFHNSKIRESNKKICLYEKKIIIILDSVLNKLLKNYFSIAHVDIYVVKFSVQFILLYWLIMQKWIAFC